MTDFFDDLMSSLDEYYPNSKRKRRPIGSVIKETSEAPDWASKSFLKPLPNGKEIEMYTINSLALALNRPVHTLRLWIKEGHLPSAPYRLPAKKDKNGVEKPGRRLYSKAMIQAAVDIFDRNGLLHTSRVEWSMNQQITTDIADVWSKIRTEELN